MYQILSQSESSTSSAILWPVPLLEDALAIVDLSLFLTTPVEMESFNHAAALAAI